MSNKMLIDATHPEETRVVVLRGGRVEEFDYESAARKLLRGNIYLAKVTRVEPSLQAAFVDYGGNRHGFLAFNEIHPDYYQIPMADRQALLDEEAAAEAEEEAAADARAEALARRRAQRDQQRDQRRSGGDDSRDEDGDDEDDAVETVSGESDDEQPQEGDDRNRRSSRRRRRGGGGGRDRDRNNHHRGGRGDDRGRRFSREADDAAASGNPDQRADDERGDDHSERNDTPRSHDDAAHGADHTRADDAAPHADHDSHAAAADTSHADDRGEAGAPQTHRTLSEARGLGDDVRRDEVAHVAVAHVAPEAHMPHDDMPRGEPATDTHHAAHADPAGEAEHRADTAKPGREHAEHHHARAHEAHDHEHHAHELHAHEHHAPERHAHEHSDASRGDIPAPRGNVEDEGVQEVNGAADAEAIEQVGNEDALDEYAVRPRRRMRSYKIQEVIKRRQIILVQVVKEERGNKGAALTTYLSLAGRYTVLMPNTARGGGISRKITQPGDRKRLKAIAAGLEVPEGMGLIIRTAGAARTEQEIRRDFEYLLRLWESVRDLTLQSVAPCLVYEEGNLIKRSIRDLYNKDIDEIVVAGREAHAEAHDFMRMLMPSHAKNVINYREPEPLFTRYQIERQLNAMFSPFVTLRSGGYLVINQTEALVAVDVNSGRSTREFSIEETALNTNLEAAEEIARQLKLRDLAGLIVIDFIDMEERRNNRRVENRLKDALRFDRARIQVGRISHFGLMEMSRQRLRTGVLEGSTSQCPHCQGTGIIRSTESVALAVLRGLEDAIMAGARASLIATTTPTVALYILNNKRAFITDMERRTGLPIVVQGSDKMQGANFTVEKGAGPVQPARRSERTAVNMDWGFESDADSDVDSEVGIADADLDDGRETSARSDGGTSSRGEGSDNDGERGEDGRRGRRRRRRRGRRGDRPENERGENGHRLQEAGSGEQGDQGFDDDMGEDAEALPSGEHAPQRTHGERTAERVDAAPNDQRQPANDDGDDGDESEGDDGLTAGGDPAQDGDGERRKRGRRRGRRGGRRGRERMAGADGDTQTDDGPTEGAADPAADNGTESGEQARSAAAPHGRFEPTDEAAQEPAQPESSPRAGHAPAQHDEAPARAEAPARESRRSRRQPSEAATEPLGDAAGEPIISPPGEEVVAPSVVLAETRAVETPAVEPVASRRRTETSSTPRIERVVLRADDATPETQEIEPQAATPRKGWWSRKLSS